MKVRVIKGDDHHYDPGAVVAEGAAIRAEIAIPLPDLNRNHKVMDGHRHHYNKPVHERVPLQIPNKNRWGAQEVPQWRRIHAGERRCVRCGFLESDIRRLQRAAPVQNMGMAAAKGDEKRVEPPPPIIDPLKMAYVEAQLIADEKPGGLNNFTTICRDAEDEIKVVRTTQGFCYAGLGGRVKGSALYFVDKAGSGDGWAISSEYVRWLYEDSPFNLCLVNDLNHYMDTRCTIQSTTLPAQYLVQAAMAFRYQQEYAGFVRSWEHLTAKGMDPSIAFLLCQAGSLHGGWFKWNGVAAHGHSIFDCNLKRNGLQNYLSRNVMREGYSHNDKKLLAPGYKSMSYGGMMSAWQGISQRHDEQVTLPGGEVREQIDSLGRKIVVVGYDCSNKDGVLAMQNLFLEANEVRYEPKESVYCQRRPSVCKDVPVSGVASAT